MSFTDIFMTQVLTFQERGSQAEPPEPQAPSRACQRASCGPQGHSLAEPYSQTRPLGPLSAAYLPWGGLALPAFLAKPACRRALCLRACGGSADRSRGGAAGRAPGLSAGRARSCRPSRSPGSWLNLQLLSQTGEMPWENERHLTWIVHKWASWYHLKN